jgi:hypothetical protein
MRVEKIPIPNAVVVSFLLVRATFPSFHNGQSFLQKFGETLVLFACQDLFRISRILGAYLRIRLGSSRRMWDIPHDATAI